LFFIAGQISQSNLGISLQSFFKILDLLPIYPATSRMLNMSEYCALNKQNKTKANKEMQHH